MGEYSYTFNATSDGTPNTQDTLVELSLSSGTVHVKRVRVRLGDGTATAGLDNDWRVDLVRKSVAGSATSGLTPTGVRMRVTGRTSGATITAKNGANAFTVGTVLETIDTAIVNGRAIFEWVARDETDYITTHPTLASGGIFSVLIQSPIASQKFQTSLFWEEP
jgi:hypothetical protein